MKAPRILVVLTLFFIPALARGATELITPDSVSASSSQTSSPAIRLIDGSGIVGYNGQTAVGLSSVHQRSLTLAWASSANDPVPSLEYIWQNAQQVCGLVLWQGVGNVGVKDFDVRAFSSSNALLGTWSFQAEEVPLGSGGPTDISPQFFPIGSEDIPVANVVRITLTVRSNYGGPYSSLSETHFTKPSDEPREGEICLIDERSLVRWHVPEDEKDQSGWFATSFSDTSWNPGLPCLGYETGALCDNLIVYLTMDQRRISGATVFDTSNSPIVHNGTRVGAVPMAPGKVLEGLRPPGNLQSYISIPHHAELNPGTADYSVGIWVYPEVPGATAGVIAQKFNANSNSGWSIVALGTSTCRVAFQLSQTQIRFVDMPGLPANQWSHVGFVANRTTQQLTGYLNGAPQGSTPLLATDSIVNPDPIFLLNTPDVFELDYRAVLDEFAVWKRALSSTDMLAVHAAGASSLSFKTAGGGASALYNQLIETNVGTEMYGFNSTVWERIRFNVTSLEGIQAMRLRMRYDDGFICYLNGVEIARNNAPTGFPAYNSAAASDRPDTFALVEDVYDVTAFLGLLQAGTNVLAIHGLNASRYEDRFLLCPQLCVDRVDCRGRNKGSDFWVTFPESFATDPSNPKEISLCLAGSPGTTGLVQMPRLAVSIPFTLDATGVARVQLNPSLAELSGSDVIEEKGVHITAERPICVVGLNHVNFSTDGYLALPTKLLGTEYLVLAYPNKWPGLPVLNGTEFGLVATEDNTLVQIVPSVTTDGHPAGVAYYLTLQQGQTYQLMNTEDGTGDLSGTTIRSTKLIAVFGGHRCANIRGQDFFCDHLVEHLPPVNHWQRNYFTGPLATRTGGDTVRIIAAFDGTTVNFNGVPVAALNRGDVHDALVTGPTAISTNGQPVLVAQYSNSSDFDGVEDSDPFMALVPPPAGYDTAYRICSPPTGGFDKNYLNITLLAGTQGATTVDGVALPAIPGVVFIPIPTTGLLVAQVPVSAARPHDVLGPLPFGVIAYGFASYNFDSYGYPAGVSFPALPPRVQTPPEHTVYSSAQTGTAAVPNIVGATTVIDNCDPQGTIQGSQTPRASTNLAPGNYLVQVSATNSAQLTGFGTMLLKVLPPWQQHYFPNDYGNPNTEATIWGCFADGDKDGDSNQKEWLFGGNPADPNSKAVFEVIPKTVPYEGGLRMRFHRRYLDPSASYLAEGSEDLQNWFNGPGIIQEISSDVVYPGGEFEEVVIEAIPTFFLPSPPKYFLRVTGSGCPDSGPPQ